ncbi:AraC family transcriptional regulator [Thiohalorhabdus sp. Cl-TMA]|uniref:AraC family transcriptional regulator n=1 Tax=Thiohalorhabdus methylotrophus TaxID=3242694 RepID=A0ABV4TW65_9GAMM
MDPLSDVLRNLRLRARVILHADFCGHWAVDTSGQYAATFHLVAGGRAWLHREGRKPLALGGGELVVFPHDARHVLSHSPEPPDPFPRNRIGGVEEGAATRLVCGYIEFEHAGVNPVLEALPDMLHLDPARERAGLEGIWQLLMVELERERPGGEAAVDRLADLLFIEVVRIFMEGWTEQVGFWAAVRDPALCRALAAIHGDPGHPWQVEELARKAALSRSAFVDRFRRFLDRTPAQYLTQWRMQLAAERLRNGGESVIAVAESLGYTSEVAFRKAFRREVGCGPGRLRREQAEPLDEEAGGL